MERDPRIQRRRFLELAVTGSGVMVAGLAGCGGSEGDAGAAATAQAARVPRPDRDVPALACSLSKTRTSIGLLVTAGASGAAAGFSLQWMKAADFVAGGSVWPSDEGLFCSGGFSGNAHLSRYDLGPGESVEVNVGEFLFDSGASTDCTGPLECGTGYVFRVFAHADGTMNRSDWSAAQACATLACGSGPVCTYTQGYWKTHGPVPTGHNAYLWPQSVKDNGLSLGTVSYTPMALLTILNTPAAGNGLVALAHQLIAAKLNLAHGSDPAAVSAAVDDADTLIGPLAVPSVGTGFLASQDTSALTQMLAEYNEGLIGPGHCS